MKKLKIALTTCICLCFCFMCGMFLVACDSKEQPEEFNPYITISGLSTACEVGGELDYSNAKILYYTNLADDEPDEIALTRDMITEFDNSTSGSKTLTVTYKTLEAKHDYKIVSEEEIVKLCSSAHTYYTNTTSSVTEIKAHTTSGEEAKWKVIVKNDESYYKYLQGEEIEEIWFKEEVTLSVAEYAEYHKYSYEVFGYKRYFEEFKPSEAVEGSVLPYLLGKINMNSFNNDILFYNYKEIDDVSIFNCTLLDEYMFNYTFEFENGKITSSYIKYDIFESLATISYNSNNEIIPELPNVEWLVNDGGAKAVKAILNEQIAPYEGIEENLRKANSYIVTETSKENGAVDMEATAYVSENEIYHEIDADGNKILDQRDWIKSEEDGCFRYTVATGSNTKELDSNGLRDNDFLTGLIGFEFNPQTHFTSAMKYSYYQENGIETYKITYTESEVDYTITYKFENGKIIFAEMIAEDGTDTYLYTREFDYETEFTIPGLPEVEWE